MSTLSYIAESGHMFGHKKINCMLFQARQEIKDLRYEFTKSARLERMILGSPKTNRKHLRKNLNFQNSIISALNCL